MKNGKIFIVILAVVLLLNINLNAGEVGIKAGAGISKINDVDKVTGVSYKYLLGFRGGLFFGMEIVKGFMIEPEVYYVQKGLKMTAGGDKEKVKLDYIEVPVLLKVELAARGFAPAIMVGPYAAFKIRAKDIFNGDDQDVKDAIENIDWGLVGGIELGFNVGKSLRFLLDFRYNHGLSKVYKVDPSLTNRGKNRSFVAMIGIGF